MAEKKALIIVDAQNDFFSGGSLAVPDAENIIEPINRLRDVYDWGLVCFTGCWHPKNHSSFAVTHDKAPFTKIALPSGEEQMLWPTHCVQGSTGAMIHSDLKLKPTDVFVEKGTIAEEDSYSGFGSPSEGKLLLQLLRQRKISEVYCVGLATDYCVGYTAMDAAALGFRTLIVKDGVRGLSQTGVEKMLKDCAALNISFITAQQVLTHTS